MDTNIQGDSENNKNIKRNRGGVLDKWKRLREWQQASIFSIVICFIIILFIIYLLFWYKLQNG